MEKGLIKIRRCTIVLDVKDYYRKGGDFLFKEAEIKEIYYYTSEFFSIFILLSHERQEADTRHTSRFRAAGRVISHSSLKTAYSAS